MRVATLLTIVALLTIGAYALIRLTPEETTLIVGGLLAVIGVPLVILSRLQLGRAFTVMPQAKGLVTRGLYSRIPHPLYVFLDLGLLGGVIVLRRAWLLVVLGLLFLIQVRQARRESRVLEQAFGDEYREYRRHTWW